jgi:hypothetical protein
MEIFLFWSKWRFALLCNYIDENGKIVDENWFIVSKWYAKNKKLSQVIVTRGWGKGANIGSISQNSSHLKNTNKIISAKI